MEHFMTLLMIVGIDIVLSADNAILIAMAAKNVDEKNRKKAILFGTAVAVVLRIAFAGLVTYLLQIPYLQALGGVLLVWIAIKLLISNDSDSHKEGGTSVLSAILMIVWADAAMSLDNVLALAAVANGDFLMIMVGILISIPIIVWGSSFCIKMMERFPVIIYIGAGILAWSAGGMVMHDKHLNLLPGIPAYSVQIGFVVGVLGMSYIANQFLKSRKK
ncbi:TerC family protein [Bacillus cereus]